MPKRPKPVRLTEQRALALVEVGERGLAEWRRSIRDTVQDPLASLEELTEAKELDAAAVQAEDAIAVLRARYDWPKAEPEGLF